MELDNEIKEQAIAFAQKTIEQIIKASSDPLISLDKKETKVYDELKSWGFLEKYPIQQHQDLYREAIALDCYRVLKFAKDNPPPPQRTKWEIVMGRMGKGGRKK